MNEFLTTGQKPEGTSFPMQSRAGIQEPPVPLRAPGGPAIVTDPSVKALRSEPFGPQRDAPGFGGGGGVGDDNDSGPGGGRETQF